jgi:AcrR family transcriptional regulator
MTKDRGTLAQRGPPKRDRLIDAASRLFYEQGVERTAIAGIAAAADVPSGNVYYYFKTKDDIVDAVVSARVAEIEATLAGLAKRYDSPIDRLKALFNSLAEQAEMISQRGCATGSLCTELSKRMTVPDPNSARLMQALIDGAEQQFQEMGRDDAHELAIEMITAYEGTAVLAHATASPELLRREAGRVDRWIDELQQRPSTSVYDVAASETGPASALPDAGQQTGSAVEPSASVAIDATATTVRPLRTDIDGQPWLFERGERPMVSTSPSVR